MNAMRPQVLPPTRGAAWLAEGWRLFQSAPLSWIALVLAYWVIMSVISMIPIAGVVAVTTLVPGLAAGFMSVAQAAERREPLQPGLLLSALRSDPRSQLVLGAVYFVTLCAVLGLTVLFDGGGLARWMLTGKPPTEPEAAGLAAGAFAALCLYLPVMAMFWFAPVLTAWHAAGALKAIFYSFFAVLLNWRAFVVYGAMVALVAFVVPFMIITLIGLFMGNRLPAMSFALPAVLMLLPTLFASFYASYRDVFGSAPEPETGTDGAP